MRVVFADLKRQYDSYAPEYEEAALRVLHSGWYILGNELREFEEAFADFMGAKYCVGVGNGQDALILALRALGIGVGDEVIVPSNTYIASVLGITENGATPVFVEPDCFYNMDPTKVEEAITPRTRAILPVHLYGQACQMEAICQIARKHDLPIVEDCAQAHGATFHGTYVGTWGTIGCFSMYPTKPLGALGDGGALLTDDPDLALRLQMLRNYGGVKKYINQIEGRNSRLDELQAAILQIGLRHLDEGNAYRSHIAEAYLRGICNPHIRLPKTRKGSCNVWHIFPILCRTRDHLQAWLLEHEIYTLCHYPIPPHLQECYRRLGYQEGDYPQAETYARQELSLPIYVGMPEEEVTYVIETVNAYPGEANE